MIANLLSANPGTTGVIYDLPSVVEGARRRIEAAGLADRCACVARDCFASVPAGGDAYLLVSIPHGWDDERCLAILKNCRRAIPKEARLRIVEIVVPPGTDPSFVKNCDITMLVLASGGRERTQAEFEQLLGEAGFRLNRVLPTTSTVSILELRLGDRPIFHPERSEAMSNRVDPYDSTYGNFKEQVLVAVRRDTYGEDIGQSGLNESLSRPPQRVARVASRVENRPTYLVHRSRRLTGPVFNEELAARSSICFFLFVPLEVMERFISDAGFNLLRREDVTGNIELTSGRWHAARQQRRDALVKIESEERFEGLQRFAAAVHRLTSERRLSRFVFVAEK